MAKRISLVLLVSLFAWTLFAGFKGDQDEYAEKGHTAPQFQLASIHGKSMKLTDYDGKLIVLNFWATWCGPCNTEMPALNQFSQQSEDITVIGINMTDNESSKTAVMQFVKEYEISFPILLDHSGSVFEKYRILSLPSTYFINEDGVIVEYHIGPLTERYLQETTRKFQ
ncbi:TlpA family protein disulfide reductase [Bacillus infantis]|uniref:TlpA family protein disulfide reductase n=1 Tax=Bacillus infantis TaxID=324767 RepID=UPI001CD35AAC|nr:TlpA disulfide reductase family protein [Bacillus infantis]MCA1041855.1 TlpA family protein disulfide reductase [Bacillus infantis]